MGAETFVILSGKDPGEMDPGGGHSPLVKSLDASASIRLPWEVQGSCWSSFHCEVEAKC